ncbi:MAG: nuclear transport factor 2 family protein [Spirochaetota bacterium]|mgnify:CR=1 FL=1
MMNVRGYAELIFSSMNSRDLSSLEAHLAENAVFDFPGTALVEGRRRIAVFLRMLFRKYPKLSFTIDDIIVDGTDAVAVWHNEGVHADGSPYANRGVTLIRTDGSAITFISDYFKDTSFIRHQHV